MADEASQVQTQLNASCLHSHALSSLKAQLDKELEIAKKHEQRCADALLMGDDAVLLARIKLGLSSPDIEVIFCAQVCEPVCVYLCQIVCDNTLSQRVYATAVYEHDSCHTHRVPRSHD